MKSTKCVIYQMNPDRNIQLVSQYDNTGVFSNQSTWCLFLVEEIPSSVIVGSTNINEDDTQTINDLLGI